MNTTNSCRNTTESNIKATKSGGLVASKNIITGLSVMAWLNYSKSIKLN